MSLLVLLVLQFEAWISRARHFEKVSPVNQANKKDVLPWMKSLTNAALAPTITRLSEVYFLRDAIVHNHIWTYRQSWAQGKSIYSDFNIDLSWQSSRRRISEIVKGTLPLSSFPRTKTLNLRVVPNFVGRNEVALAFKTIKDALQLIEKLGYLTISPKTPYVRFKEKRSFPFWSLISEIQRSFISKRR